LKADLAVSFAGKSRHPIREAGDGTATATELLECVNVNVSGVLLWDRETALENFLELFMLS